ncbi:MAG: hypothetical protein II307_01980 [Alistipes sp.]|nr:hypothetical protein [Alistipes sp.]
MSMVLQFRMLSDENDNFVRDYEVMYDMSLFDFHRFILSSLKYDDCMASFFTADDRWERIHEFTAMDMGEVSEDAPTPMDSVLLGQVVLHNRARLIYLFDMFAERAYYLELTGAKEAEAGFKYPRVAFENAPAPDQYDPDAVNSDEGSIFDEMMGDFNDFDGDDNYDDEY